MRHSWTGVAVFMVMLGVAGCSQETPVAGPTSASASASSAAATPTPAPTPSPTPTSEVQDQTNAELGIVFSDVPDLTGDEADVYNLLATYEVEYWRTQTTNTMSPAFSAIGSPTIQAKMSDLADYNVRDQVDLGGTFRTRVFDIVVTGDTATGTACEDYRDVTMADKDGPTTPEAAGFGEPDLIRTTMQRSGPGEMWMLMSDESLGSC